MNIPEPSLDDLSRFMAVLSEGGFRAAAKRLHCSPSNLSETVVRLEAWLGMKLLIRTTRQVRPTEAGFRLATRLQPALAEARTALRDASKAGQGLLGRLRLSVPDGITIDILPPLIDRFLCRHPRVGVELLVEDHPMAFGIAQCDAEIRLREPILREMASLPLGGRSQILSLAASPAYVATHGRPMEPDQLLGHECIRLRNGHGELIRWTLERDGEVVVLDPPGRVVIGHDGAAAAIALACAGHGIIATSGDRLQPHLDTADLLPILRDWWRPIQGPRIYFQRRGISPPLRAFLDVIAETQGVDAVC